MAEAPELVVVLVLVLVLVFQIARTRTSARTRRRLIFEFADLGNTGSRRLLLFCLTNL
jgi:hypothetical protein